MRATDDLTIYNHKELAQQALKYVHKFYEAWQHYQQTGKLDPRLWPGTKEQYIQFENNIKTLERLRSKKRKNEEISNDHEEHGQIENTSLSNSPNEETMYRHGGTIEEHTQEGAPQEGGEQQVTKPHHIWRRFPNTETAALKWVQTVYPGSNDVPPTMGFDQQDKTAATSLLASGGGAWISSTIKTVAGNTGLDYTIPRLLQLRMTSPYQIVKTSIDGAPVANSQPNWLELFDSKYTYYHVMETEWELTFNFGIPNTGSASMTNYQQMGLYIFWKYTNEDDPPVSFQITPNTIAYTGNVTNTAGAEGIPAATMTGGVGTYYLTPDDYFRMGGWHHKHVLFNTTHSTTARIEGKYKFGQCKMDIKTLSTSDSHGLATTAEGWNQVQATPQFPELLSVIIVQDNARHAVRNDVVIPLGLRMETEQIIQFKDLRKAYKFPTPGLAQEFNLGTINTDAQFFWRGAGYS